MKQLASLTNYLKMMQFLTLEGYFVHTNFDMYAEKVVNDFLYAISEM